MPPIRSGNVRLDGQSRAQELARHRDALQAEANLFKRITQERDDLRAENERLSEARNSASERVRALNIEKLLLHAENEQLRALVLKAATESTVDTDDEYGIGPGCFYCAREEHTPTCPAAAVLEEKP